MKISTLSIVVGNKACNAKCGFCVSRMTGFAEVKGKPILRQVPEQRPMNFDSAITLAKIAGTTTVLLTGKGEPTLAPDEITYFLDLLQGQFPFVELQTNGLAFGRALRDGDDAGWGPRLTRWRRAGLNTVAVSVVGASDAQNAAVYHEDYPPLAATVRHLHDLGYTVRLSLMLVGGIVDSPESLARVLDWCREHRVEQLTVRPVRRPENTKDDAVSAFVRARGITAEQERDVMDWVMSTGKLILRLSHGADVYDVGGQNVCLTDCLTVPDGPDQIRTLIYYSSGRLAYHWQYPGATLLGGAE